MFCIFSLPLTLAATAFFWAKRRVFWLPEPCSIGHARSTGHVNVTLATATVASESVIIYETVIEAVQGSRESARLSRSGKNWVRARGPWGRGLVPVYKLVKEVLWSTVVFWNTQKRKYFADKIVKWQ